MDPIKNILIIGSDCEVGSFLFKNLKKLNFEVIGTSRKEFNHNESKIKFDLLDENYPFSLKSFDACIICAGLNNIDFCQKNYKIAKNVNLTSTIKLIDKCKKDSVYVVFFSTVDVFNGKGSFYTTYDLPSPKNVYGKLKIEVENFLMNNYSKNSAILRMTKIISSNTPLIKKWIDNYNNKEEIIAYSDKYLCPISLKQVLLALQILLKDKKSGYFHLGGTEEVTYYDFALSYFREREIFDCLIKPVSFYSEKSNYYGKYSSLRNSFDL